MAQYFVLVKREGYCRKGSMLSARESATLLIDNSIWPLWEKTRCRKMVAEGDKLLIYLAGNEPGSQSVIASAKIAKISDWNRKYSAMYPLMLDGIPERVLHLCEVKHFKHAVHVPEVLSKLSFAPKNRSKWGTAFMGGMRNLNKADYSILGGC